MDAELLELARTVDLSVLGSRIRDARVAKSLTQTAVAGAEMSTAYISRIESGQRRPDPELLEVIAERVGVAIDELVMGTSRDLLSELRLALDWAELSLKTGDADGALRQADEILTQLTGSSQDDLRRAALQVKAGALKATGKMNDAIMVLEDLVEAGPIDLQWISSMNSLSHCFRDSGDMARSIEVGEHALTELRKRDLDGTDQALALSMIVASAYSERGDNGVAQRLARRALDKAETLGSTEGRAKAYWTASILASRSGEASSALTLARKALGLMEFSEDSQNLARLRSQLGILTLRTDAPDAQEALTYLQAAEGEMLSTDAPAVDRAFNRVNQARALLMLGQTDQARERAIDARITAATLSPLVAADASVLLGQISVSESDAEGAQKHFRDAVSHLTAAGSDRGAAQLWFELGCLLEDTADTIGAMDAYRRAGASTGLVASAPLRTATTHSSDMQQTSSVR